MSRKQRSAPGAPGWVYVMTNPSMTGMVKIGMTSRSPAERAAELSSGTALPTPFTVAWCAPVSDCHLVEQAVHRMLEDKRVDKTREFFSVDVVTARQIIQAASGAFVNMVAAQNYPTLPPRRTKSAFTKRNILPMRRRRYGNRRLFPRRSVQRLFAGVLLLVLIDLLFIRRVIPREFPNGLRLIFYIVESVGRELTRLVARA